jgi:hypothetical protein
MNSEIIYTSLLPAEHLPVLQDLLFFNKYQSRYRDAIIASVEEYGEPQVRKVGDYLRIHTRHLGEVQSLFALEVVESGHRLIGFAAYTRSGEDALVLLHIGVEGDFASDGPRAEEMLTMNLVRRFLDVGRTLGGIKKAVLLYGPAGYREIPTRG